MKKLLVSFSGGKTSAFMCYLLLKFCSDLYDMVFVFANTSQEKEETLKFVDLADRWLNLKLIWVEAVIHHDQRKGATHKVVTFETAKRKGEVFEEMIKKYGIPNKAYPHCTRELKANPIHSYIRSIGWEDYLTAIGIRTDEKHRMGKSPAFIYPMVTEFDKDKTDVNDFWESMPFTLELEEHEGNCSWCWKKSLKKHFKLIKANPEIFDFPREMESRHGLSGHNVDGTKRVFFRGNKSTEALFKEYELIAVSGRKLHDSDPDEYSGCSESCEPFAELAN